MYTVEEGRDDEIFAHLLRDGEPEVTHEFIAFQPTGCRSRCGEIASSAIAVE